MANNIEAYCENCGEETLGGTQGQVPCPCGAGICLVDTCASATKTIFHLLKNNFTT
ncbi:hypothetical protein JOC78_002934 [Bacillus ectoiniformans]|nr:hypothetical protein [Bacillus ectoiniformans]